MTRETYNEAMRILDELSEKVDWAIAKLSWNEYKEDVLKWQQKQ